MTPAGFRSVRFFVHHWLFLAVGLGLFGLSIAAHLYENHEATLTRERARLLGQARAIRINLERQLAGADNALLGIRELYARPDARDADINKELTLLCRCLPGVRTILAAGADGIVRFASRDEVLGVNLASRAYFQTVKADPDPDTLYLSPPFRTTLGVWVMNLGRSLPIDRGGFGGLIVAALDPEYFSTLLSSVNYAPDMRSSLVHGDGELFVMVPDTSDLVGINLAKPGTLFTRHERSGAAEEVFTGTALATGERRMVAWVRFAPGPGRLQGCLEISTSRDLSAITEKWRQDAASEAAGFAVVAMAGIVSLAFFQRRQRASQMSAEEANTKLRESESQIEALRVAKLAAEAADRMKTDFLASVSHELRTPLNPILGMLQLALGTPMSIELREYLEQVQNAAARLHGLIEELITLTGLDIHTVRVSPLGVTEIGTMFATAIEPPARAKGLDLTVRQDPADAARIVSTDFVLLRLILVKLGENAVKFTTRGSVSLSVTLAPGENGRLLASLAVADTGMGIAAKRIPDVLAGRCDECSLSKRHGGLGLGLAVVRKALALLGGELSLTSEPDSGSVFTAVFPVDPCDPATLICGPNR